MAKSAAHGRSAATRSRTTGGGVGSFGAKPKSRGKPATRTPSAGNGVPFKPPKPATAPGTKTKATPPPPASPPTQPFLTPDQQQALDTWNAKYSGAVASLTQNDIDSVARFNQGVSADTQTNAQNVDMTNQSMAARGMFESSLRDGALNDLATTLQQQVNLLQTTRDTALLADQTSRTSLAGQDAAQQSFYNAAAVQNAQNVPVTPPPAPPPPAKTPPASQPPPSTPPPTAPPTRTPSAGNGVPFPGARAGGQRPTGGAGLPSGPKVKVPGTKNSATIRMNTPHVGAGSGFVAGGG